MERDDEGKRLQTAALQNVQTILHARQRAEQDLLKTKEALEEETRILEVLNKTGALLASKLDVESLVQAVTDACTTVSGAQFGAFFYTTTNADGDAFVLFVISGAPREAFEKFGHPRATPLFAPTFRGEGVIRLGDVATDPRYGKMGPGMPRGHLPVRSYLAVPVVTQSGEVIGGLFFGHPDCDIFTERAERLVVGIAAQAAIAMDNARLYEQTKRAAEERARLLEAERAARLEVERISLLKDEFVATLSHELRTPLTSVLGWAHILLKRVTEEGDIRRGLEIIERNARAQAKLIEDLLDMNRIVSGKIRLDVQKVDLASIVESAVESVRPSSDAKGITLRTTIDPNAGSALGDPSRLQQVVWNLLTNAVKFTPKGGKIDVILQRVNSHLEITVHDSGVGIEPAFLPHVFERFRQADASTTRKYGGLGIGLSIVKHLVELHGGSVRADSSGPGAGATFVASLPVRSLRELGEPREHPATGRSPSTPTPQLSLAGVKVLIIDDERDARELVAALLTEAHAQTFTAGSASEGLALVRSQHPDVIISDIGMPGRDGYQFIQDVRALVAAEGGRTPAVALTAFARSEDRTRAMLAGYQTHLSKPIEPSELLATIHSLATHAR